MSASSASLPTPEGLLSVSGARVGAWSSSRLGLTLAQNQQRKIRPLTMPVLAIGGAESRGEMVGNGIKPAADDVQTVVIPGAGQFVAEQAPEEMLAALTEFLAPSATEGESIERRSP
jgi:pimeloyl-ACP methyl ester carboxylesterase